MTEQLKPSPSVVINKESQSDFSVTLYNRYGECKHILWLHSWERVIQAQKEWLDNHKCILANNASEIVSPYINVG